MKNHANRLIAVTAGYAVVMAAWLVIRPAPGPIIRAGDDIAQAAGELLLAPLVLAGLVAAVRAQRHLRTAHRRQALVPPFLCLSAMSWGAGQLVYTYYEQVLRQSAPLPSWADAGFLAAYPLLLTGILLLSSHRLTAVSRGRIILDALMILTALGTFSWYFLLGPTLVQATNSPLAKLVASAYPAGDLVLIACLLLLATRWRDDVIRRAGLLLAVALTVIIATDCVYLYQSLHNSYATGGLIDVGWPLGYMLIVCAAQALTSRVKADQPAAETETTRPGAETVPAFVLRSLLPYALVPGVAGLAVYAFAIRERIELRYGVLGGATVLIGMIILRQVLTILENVRLYRDVEAKRAQLESLATTDPLTGLPNHRALMSAIDQELQRALRYGRTCSVAVVDIDHFKAINDSLGHGAGDEALRQFGAVLRSAVRGIDIVARWGGEEFVIILPEATADGSLTAAENLRARVAAHRFRVGGGIHLTCSIGVAFSSSPVDTRDELLASADSAMYAAKRLGRNQVRSVTDPAVAALNGDRRTTSRDEAALLGTVEALAALVDARDNYTAQHSQDVARLAMRMAMAAGLDPSEAHLIGIAARLHDIGKVAVPDAVIEKPGPLTDAEWAQIRMHPSVGADVVARVPALRALAPAIRAHHERWDGGGYPDGLAGKDIPLAARIVAVADAFETMVSGRTYRAPRSVEAALSEVRLCAGSRFDPDLTQTLVDVVAGDAKLLIAV